MSYNIDSYEEFISFCDKAICPRKVKYNSKTCVKDYKRESCFKRYNEKTIREIQKQLSKNDVENEFRKKAWIYLHGSYKGFSEFEPKESMEICSIWKILTDSEKYFVKENFKNEFFYLLRYIDVCHIIDKSIKPDDRYNLNNVYLACRYFHSLLTQFKHPVTKKPLSKEQILSWDLAAKNKQRKMVIGE